MAREAPRIVLSPYEFIDLRRLANAHSTPQALAFRPASSSAVPSPTSPLTTKSPPNSPASPRPSPSGAGVSAAVASAALTTSPAAAARPLFPPEDRHKVIILATTKPADVGLPTTPWSLDDLAYHILQDAHYRDMSRTAVQRILAEADLQPHKSRYWLHSDDPDFEAKRWTSPAVPGRPAPVPARRVGAVRGQKTGIQALERRGRPRPGAGPAGAARPGVHPARHALPAGDAGGADGAGDRRRDARGGDLGHVRHVRDVVEQSRNAMRCHWVMDNLNTHYTFELCQYLGRLSGVWETRPPLTTGVQRRAFLTDPSHKHVVHYTPKHGSWLNQVEIWFGVLCRRLLRAGSSGRWGSWPSGSWGSSTTTTVMTHTPTSGRTRASRW